MNSVQLIGRLTADPDVRYTDGGLTIAKFTLAVDRRFKRDGEATADFIRCVSFGKTAEFIERYFVKGMRMAINGRIQTGSYDNQEGVRVYTTDIVVENCEFTESKRGRDDSVTSAPSNSAPNPVDEYGFENIPDGIDEELPFN